MGMKPDELIDYIKEHHLEFQMTNILLANLEGIFFLPILKPAIILSESRKAFAITGFGSYNLCHPSTRNPIPIPSEFSTWSQWNRMISHSEHLSGFLMKSRNTYSVSILYSRKHNVYRELRETAFRMYLSLSPINNLNTFFEQADTAIKAITASEKGMGYFELADILMDNGLKDSVQRCKYDIQSIRQAYAIHLHKLYYLIFTDDFINSESSLVFNGNYLCLSSKYLTVPKVKTDLSQDISIVHKDDQIPQILFKLAFDLKPSTILIATGYVYDSGLQMIYPALVSCLPGKNTQRELVCGELYHYLSGASQHTPNRQTAITINEFLEDGLIGHLYTHPDSFYHGKFYYLCNDEVGYLISGSSNVTSTAYIKNTEFDILYRFNHKTTENRLEREFLQWYDSLKKECIEIMHLDEELFPINLHTDEYGHTQSSSILRTITSEEERERYSFLEHLQPTSIDTTIFNNKFYRPFKGYYLFIFTNIGISVMESFNYGNSCYVLSTTNKEVINKELRFISKDQLKEKKFFVTSIVHDTEYKNHIYEIFHK